MHGSRSVYSMHIEPMRHALEAVAEFSHTYRYTGTCWLPLHSKKRQAPVGPDPHSETKAPSDSTAQEILPNVSIPCNKPVLAHAAALSIVPATRSLHVADQMLHSGPSPSPLGS